MKFYKNLWFRIFVVEFLIVSFGYAFGVSGRLAYSLNFTLSSRLWDDAYQVVYPEKFSGQPIYKDDGKGGLIVIPQ